MQISPHNLVTVLGVVAEWLTVYMLTNQYQQGPKLLGGQDMQSLQVVILPGGVFFQLSALMNGQRCRADIQGFHYKQD